MRIKCKNALSHHFSVIIAANRFTSALYVLCICLQIHVLQRISAMQPIIAELYGNLEHLHLAFVLRSTINVLCSTNVCVFCIRKGALSITFSNPFPGPSWFVLLGLYGSCPCVSIVPSLGFSMAPFLGSPWLLILGLYGSCSWVSMDPSLGSLWLLPLGLYCSFSWVSMDPPLGSLWLLLSGLYMAHALGSLWLLLLVLYGSCSWVSMVSYEILLSAEGICLREPCASLAQVVCKHTQ